MEFLTTQLVTDSELEVLKNIELDIRILMGIVVSVAVFIVITRAKKM